MAKLVSQQLDEIQAKLDYLMQPVNLSPIKSIQQISGTSGTGSSSSNFTSYNDITIAAVNPAKTVVLLRSTPGMYGGPGSGTAASYTVYSWYATLTNSTTVRVGGSQAYSYHATVYAVVIEYV